MQTAELIDRLLGDALATGALGPVTLAEALRLAARAEGKAEEIGVPVSVAVVDAEGVELLFHRMAGSLPASARLARDKAWSAAAFRMSTEALGRQAQPGGMLPGVETSCGGRVVLFGGGLPLLRGGRIAGAIGISGGTVAQDIVIAAHALDGFFEQAG
ncbi:heme-binding protein [Salipiger bermudensis]|uniref:GlcG/HbpS family heme-binding protein n=1 Tax=Salipiger bermudensis TaxID=344736 RepID=UPI001C993557|nr:heme-binding protein [Salipiger bermudensis]MBY6003022.1 heme-binding protein [Salipiger bermudensis]